MSKTFGNLPASLNISRFYRESLIIFHVCLRWDAMDHCNQPKLEASPVPLEGE
jgi:hypothetical protein